MNVPSKRTSNYVRPKLKQLKGERDQSTITVGDLSTPQSEMITPRRGRKPGRTYLSSATLSISWL